MYCPRLDHFVRLNNDGTLGRCGHMIHPTTFKDFKEMEESPWISRLKENLAEGVWPSHCVRCMKSEQVKGKSIRTNSLERHKILRSLRKDYLIMGGVLDNTCNSACQTCNAGLSTKIGSLQSRNYKRINNYNKIELLPEVRILEVDINGGEPTASPNYKNLLRNLPTQTKIVRMNTNGSRIIEELQTVLEKGITVIVTLSLDGVSLVHDYVRWPIRWIDYVTNVDAYLDLRKKFKNLHLDAWTTVSCLNVKCLPEIIQFAKQKGIPHDWAFLERPDVLSVRHKNWFTTPAKYLFPDKIATGRENCDELISHISKQDRLRKIDYKDYFNFPENFSRNS